MKKKKHDKGCTGCNILEKEIKLAKKGKGSAKRLNKYRSHAIWYLI